ncbi:MAG: GntR family transcriptional regulator [Novosphingobium sp.]|nr:GntR family transcriptional regulator [Novosphingobium sp.]
MDSNPASFRTAVSGKSPEPGAADPEGSAQRVYRGIMKDLEEGRMVPGQSLAETKIAALYGVGRNAVREAMQQLAARGVMDLSRHRSPAIRLLDKPATFEILDVAGVMTALAARSAAHNHVPHQHAALTEAALAMLVEADASDEPGMFSRARRHFYRALLHIGGNRELQRLFPAIGMHLIYAQYRSRRLRGIRLADYQEIMAAVVAGDPARAEQAALRHVENVRQVIAEMR